MKDVRDNPFSFLDDWYGRLDDIIEDLKNNGFAVLNATNEFIDVSDENDKEYVLKLGGTERTITINKIEALDESLIPITEGGIYPVDLDSAAIEAFEDKLSQILNGYVGVKKLELIPSYGFGGPGIYWYKCDIDLGDDVIENLLDAKSTPEAYKANENNDLIIYMPSITVTCSHDNEYEVYVDLDSRNESDDYDELKNEENIISDKIIAMLTANETDLVELLKEYEILDDDYEEYDESLIPIKEWYDEDEWDDDELASIYGGDSRDSQKAIADEMKELYLDESSHPKLGKRVKSLKGWKIYQGTDDNGDEIFRCFTPDDDRPTIGYEDWETETLEQAISWIENYDLEESKKPTNESNKEDLTSVSKGDSSDSDDGKIIIERDTFGNYEENVFTTLDNIEILASSYKEVNSNTLKTLIDRLEDELDTLKKINMKLITGIKQITL